MTSQRTRNRSRSYREGITLLEIVLSLALIAIAMTLLAQLVSIGNHAAQYARDTSKAQLYCESVMAEVVAGLLPADAVALTPFEVDPNWAYSIDVGTTTSETLIAVRVTAQNVGTVRVASFSLTQWLPAPVEDDSSTTGDSI